MINEKDKLLQKQLLAYAKDLISLYDIEKERRQTLEKTLQKMQTMTKGVRHGIITLDKDLTILEANKAFFDLCNIERKDIIGTKLSTILVSDGWKPVFEEITNLRETEEILITPDKLGFQYIRVIRSPVINEKNKFDGVILAFYDESYSRSLNLFRSELLSHVSNEFKKPLKLISLMLEQLKSSVAERLSEEEINFFTVIEQNKIEIDATLNDILTFISFAATGSSDKEQGDVREILISWKERSDSALLKEYTIEVDFPTQPVIIFYASDLLRRAVDIMIKEAIKYHPKKLVLSLSVEKEFCDLSVSFKLPSEGKKEEELFIEEISDKSWKQLSELKGHLSFSILHKTAIIHNGSFRFNEYPNGMYKLSLILALSNYEPHFDYRQIIKSLEKKVSSLQAQNIQYAQDLVKTYTDQKIAVNRLEKTEKQLLRSEKLSTVGQMFAGISHEINNMLNPIIGYSELLFRHQDNLTKKQLSWLQSIQDAAWRAANLLEHTLDFSKIGNENFIHVDLCERIDKNIDFFHFKLRKAKVTVEKKYLTSNAIILGIISDLDQLISNLLINAIDAMPKGGKIYITINESLSVKNKNDAFVELRIKDSGIGIPIEKREKIFEPFFTTKDKGTGLGLYITHSIVEKLGGTIDLHSEEDKYTEFIMRFPIS